MTKMSDADAKTETCKYTQANGVNVIAFERPPAVSPTANADSKIGTVWRLLLADETETFGCDHLGDPACMKTFTSVWGVLSHQKSHSSKMVRREVNELQAKLDEIEAEKKAEHERRSNGIRAGKQRARERERNGAGPTEEIKNLARRVIITHNAMHAAIDEHQKAFLTYMKAVDDYARQPQVDPEIAEKAAKFDALMGIVNGGKK